MFDLSPENQFLVTYGSTHSQRQDLNKWKLRKSRYRFLAMYVSPEDVNQGDAPIKAGCQIITLVANQDTDAKVLEVSGPRQFSLTCSRRLPTSTNRASCKTAPLLRHGKSVTDFCGGHHYHMRASWR